MRRRLVPGLVALALSLAACSGDEDAPAPTLEPIDPSASASATAGAVPSQAAAPTPEGATEFVRFFYQAVGDAYLKKDAAVLRELSAPDCEACAGFIDTVERLSAENARVGDGYDVEVLSVETPGLEPDQDTLTALVVLKVAEFVRYDSSGAVTTTEPAVERAVQSVDLRRLPDGWQVAEVTQG